MQTYQKGLWASVFFLFMFWCTAFGQAPVFKAPADYNDYIVTEQAVIGRKIEQFNKALAAEQIKEAKKLHGELLSRLDASITKIGSMPDFRGNTSFKNAAFELFVFYKMIIESDYADIIRIVEKEGVNDKTFGRINNIFASIQRDEAVMYGQFDKAQKAFSEQFKMKLEENRFEKEREQQEPSEP